MESLSETPPADDVQARLAQIERLLVSDPAIADAKAAELLASLPGQPMALLFRGIAQRLMARPASAVEILASLCRDWPSAPLPQLQLGLALREAGENERALEAMRRTVAIRPDFVDAWLALADLLTAMADTEGADQAFAVYIRHAMQDPRLRQAADALRESRDAEAEPLLRAQLDRHPNDVVALCMLADIAARHTRFDSAERLLKRCLDLAPGYKAARHNHVVVLMRQHRTTEALEEVDRLLAEQPTDAGFSNLRAAILIQLGEYQQAIQVYRSLLDTYSAQPGTWTSLGHALRTVGQREQSVEAYRRAISLAPHFGEAYWNLANLKNLQITDAELEAMRAQLDRAELGSEDRIHFHFAVGKALEDRGTFAESFRQYAEGNRLRRRTFNYQADDVSDLVSCSREIFSAEFFAARAGHGASAADPIFIVGLPRTGSTLVEQILASHSAVEGTTELPYITAIAKSLSERTPGSGKARYPEALAKLDAAECRELGEQYLRQSRVLRKQGRPFFVDKMPNNFAHLGLIHLILPEARIIDVRRHPLACGLSLFRHLFAHGQHFSYDLEEIGRYYRDYVQLMAHFDAVLPGRVHRVTYERLVEDTESEVRRLLEYCGLPVEESCLRFHESRRAVSTPSSEQVRTPIFRDGIDHWRHYEPWLDPLKAQLGELVDVYPGVPAPP